MYLLETFLSVNNAPNNPERHKRASAGGKVGNKDREVKKGDLKL